MNPKRLKVTYSTRFMAFSCGFSSCWALQAVLSNSWLGITSLEASGQLLGSVV